MAYLLGSQVPDNKKLNKSLTNIFGIGINQANSLCKKLGFSQKLKSKDLSKNQKIKLEKLVKKVNLVIKADLRRVVLDTKKRLLSIRLQRAVRSRQGFPIRGQRTHTNAQTSKKIR